MAEGLRKNVLNFRETLFQGVAASAPAGAAVATMTGSAAYAGGSLPLAAVIAFVIVLLNAYIIKRISVHVASAGGYYEYTRQGLGRSAGAFVGFASVLYQVFALAFISLSMGVFVPALLSSVFNIATPGWLWLPLVIATSGFGFIISFLGIKGSLRYAMVMGTLEIIIVVVIGLWIIISNPSVNTPTVFTTKYATGGFSGVAIGVLFMYTAFAGFGSMTPLGEEARNAKKMLGNAIVLSSVVLSLFFIFAAYSFTVGWGPSNMGSYANQLVPGILLAMRDIGPLAAVLITIFYVNSILTDSVVFNNSVSRVVLSMGRDSVLPESLSRVHSDRKTPHVAGLAVTVFSIVVAVAGVEELGGFGAFIMTGTVATLATLLVHMFANVSLPTMLKRRNLKVGALNVLLPAAATAVLVIVFYGTFISLSLPVVVATYIFVGWLVLGGALIFLKRKGIRSITASAAES